MQRGYCSVKADALTVKANANTNSNPIKCSKNVTFCTNLQIRQINLSLMIIVCIFLTFLAK